MLSNEDTVWSEIKKALISQEDTSRYEVRGQKLPESIDAGFHGLIRRPVLFYDVTFPSCGSQSGTLLFSQVTFKHGVYFHNCSFGSKILQFDQCSFEEDLTFVDCSMPEIVSLEGSKMQGCVSIRHSSFDRLHILPGNSGQPALFEKPVNIEGGCSFNELVMLKANCNHAWRISDSVFEKQFAFSNSSFDGGLHLKSVEVKTSPDRKPRQFSDGFYVNNCTLKTGLTLEQVRCDGDFTLFNSVIDGPLQLIDSTLNGSVTFMSVDKGSKGECDIDRTIARLPGALEPLYRYAKVAKASRGDLDAAGQLYYLERKAHNAAARANARWLARPWSNKSNIWTWLELLVGEGLLGYGEKPLRPLLWAAGTIMMCAILFWSIDAVSEISSFGNYLYFSVVTFTTLGYGDLRPEPGLPRLIAAAEAILGVTLMSMFLVVLARRFMR